MTFDLPLLEEKKEIEARVREKKQIEEKLVLAGGQEYHFLLEDCSDLLDMISEVSEIKNKKDKKMHAAFETKVKFSRKIRRKAKDLNNFEQKLIKEYDSKHITLEHGRKMVAIVKLLRSSDDEKAQREAAEFYELENLECRLIEIKEILLKKSTQIEKTKRTAASQLADIEWLEKEPALNAEKIDRHTQRTRLKEALQEARTEYIISLESMPLYEILKKVQEQELEKLGFPKISISDIESLRAFLHKAKLEEKSAGQLQDMAQLSEKRLHHLGIDLAGFRKEILTRQTFFLQIMHMQTTDFLSDLTDGSSALTYLSGNSQKAKKTGDEMEALGKTAKEDELEWQRAKKIAEKKSEIAGANKEGLEKTLQELDNLQEIIEGKIIVAHKEETVKSKRFLDLVKEFIKIK